MRAESALLNGSAFVADTVHNDLRSAGRAVFVAGSIDCHTFIAEILPLQKSGFQFIHCLCDIRIIGIFLLDGRCNGKHLQCTSARKSLRKFRTGSSSSPFRNGSGFISASTTRFCGNRKIYLFFQLLKKYRLLKITPPGHVVYQAEHDSCRRFPEPASGDLRAGGNRNFQVFDPLDFLAEVTQHIPNKGEHTIRYYGWYSNKSRGMRAKLARLGEAVAVRNIEAVVDVEEEDTPFRKTCRSRWREPRCGNATHVGGHDEKSVRS